MPAPQRPTAPEHRPPVTGTERLSVPTPNGDRGPLLGFPAVVQTARPPSCQTSPEQDRTRDRSCFYVPDGVDPCSLREATARQDRLCAPLAGCAEAVFCCPGAVAPERPRARGRRGRRGHRAEQVADVAEETSQRVRGYALAAYGADRPIGLWRRQCSRGYRDAQTDQRWGVGGPGGLEGCHSEPPPTASRRRFVVRVARLQRRAS